MSLLELIYYLGYSLKKSRAISNRKRLPCRVISIGNITAGGTGKTPAVIAIAEEARKRGLKPVILTRGYKGRAKGPCFVSRGSGPLLSADEAGDEPFLMSELLRDVPVVKCADRYRGGIFAIRELSLQPLLFILDDGFQHWRLFRDMDILLIDSINPFGNRKLLPSGVLREPLKEIRRADMIVLTKTDGPQMQGQDALIKEIGIYNPTAPVFFSEHRPVCLRTASGRELPLDSLAGRDVIAFCGIGNPESFRDTLLYAQANIKKFIGFRDHFRYRPGNVSHIKDIAEKYRADWIVTTEKDIIRLRQFELPGNLVSLGIKFRIEERFYDNIFAEA